MISKFGAKGKTDFYVSGFTAPQSYGDALIHFVITYEKTKLFVAHYAKRHSIQVHETFMETIYRAMFDNARRFRGQMEFYNKKEMKELSSKIKTKLQNQITKEVKKDVDFN